MKNVTWNHSAKILIDVGELIAVIAVITLHYGRYLLIIPPFLSPSLRVVCTSDLHRANRHPSHQTSIPLSL